MLGSTYQLFRQKTCNIVRLRREPAGVFSEKLHHCQLHKLIGMEFLSVVREVLGTHNECWSITYTIDGE